MLRFCKLLLMLALPVSAQAESEYREILWQSTAGNSAAQTREITTLFVALYNAGFLKTRDVKIGKGQFLEPLLLQEGIIVGRGVAPALDAMLCDLNPDTCRRERRSVPAAQYSQLDTHVGGYGVSTTRWVYSAGDEIRVPNHPLEADTFIQSVPVPQNWSPSQFVATADLDCTSISLNGSCNDLAAALNPKVYRSRPQEKAFLPVLRYTTPLVVTQQSAIRSQNISKLSALPSVVGEREEESFQWSTSYTQFTRSAPMTDLLLDTISLNINRVGDVKKFSTPEDTFFDHQKPLFELLNHPLSSVDELPEAYQKPIKILVLDEAFEATSCDLVYEVEGVTTPPSEVPGEDCVGVSEVPAHPTRDHAPHIIGLLNAPLNGQGMVGINPYSNVLFAEIRKEFSNDDDFRDAQLKLIVNVLDDDIRIANLSWGFPSELDNSRQMKQVVEMLSNRLLIVAAAGNEAKALDAGCDILPACLHDVANLITVVGIDRDQNSPGLWREGVVGTNTHPGFHVAAVADNVLSTLRDNQLGTLSGTSQAAPQVSATAALIFSAAAHYFPEIAAGDQVLSPKVVKDRIIYSSDLFRNLRPSIMGGRLNVSRAIDIANTQVVLKRPVEGSDTETIEVAFSGSLIEPPSGNQLWCRQPDGTDKKYHWSNIRRLSYDPDRRRYVVFFHAAGTPPDERVQAPLERITDCKLSTKSNLAVLETEDGEVSFRLQDVIDYTSAIFE